MDYTTLNKIRSKAPCEDGWQKLLKHLGKTKADDEQVSFKTILDSNGLEDAIWCLMTHESDSKVRLFNCDVAEHVLHIFKDKYPDDKRPEEAIETARAFANGNATQGELAAAWAAAGAAFGAAFGAVELKFQQELFIKTFCGDD